MGFTAEEKESMRKKLEELKKLMDFQFEMGEDTQLVSGKIRELEQLLAE